MAQTIESTDVADVHGMVVLNPDGTAIGTPVGGATSANQTNGSQKTQIVDAGGEAATVTGGKLDVNATASLAGEAIPASGATEAVTVQIVDGSGNQIASFGGGVQYTEGATDTTITGTAVMWEDTGDALKAVSAASPLPVTAAVSGTVGVNLESSDITLNVDGSGVTQPVSNAGLTELSAAINASSQMDVNIAANGIGLATSAKQDTIIGHLDGVEGLLTTIDADTGNISTKIDTVAGAVSGAEMQVDVITMPTVTVNAHAVTNAGTFAVQVDGSALTSLQLADDVVATLGTTTYTEASTKGTTIGAVRRDADTTLVDTTNEIGPLQMDANGRLKVEAFSGETLPVSLTSTTVTGTVAVTQSGTWDEVGINDSGNSITVDNAQLSVVGTGTEATAMRVTIATDSTGVLSVDDNGASLTIDNADITSIKTAVEIIDNAISGSEMQVDVVAALPAGTNAIGKLAANSGVDIGDVDVTSISAGTNLVGDVGIQPRTTNGFDTFMASGSDGSSILVATAQAVKASAGKVFGYYLYNPEAAVTFVHFYNTAQGSVTVGTTNPLFTLPIPAGSGANLMSDIGITFGTAITIAATTTAGGNTAPATGVSAVIFFK